ncbi:MAG TPA: ABC transporter permease subunit [Candidatus Limnocylindrales bacterium]|nr:ABC transporter permease subunit [Candidatus Limnocylindrales bacterium]
MTAVATDATPSGNRVRGGRLRRAVSNFWSGISAVSIKELRGRMRGRRAFAVLTIYLLLLGLFSFGVYVYLKSQASQLTGFSTDFGGAPFPATQTLGNGTALSAGIGHAIFGGLLFVETLLVLVLAPAFTTGAISLEREKQTLDMLITTPLSTLGMVIGKLFSALTYVFLLILASIPFASLVFVFGGVGPEDLLRAYAFLFALAFGMGAIGLFVSAVVKRTQTATVVTFVIVLVISIGTAAGHQFWQVAGRQSSTGTGLLLTQRANRAPEAVLWLNPFVANLDMVCATAPDTYHASCDYISSVTGRPYFGSPTTTDTPPGIMEPPIFRFPGGGEDLPGVPEPAVDPDFPNMVEGDGGARQVNVEFAAPGVPPEAEGEVSNQVSFGFPRDSFWPKSAAAFVGLGVLLTLLSAQLVAPSRRLRIPRLSRPRRDGSDSPPPPVDNDTTDQPSPEAV